MRVQTRTEKSIVHSRRTMMHELEADDTPDGKML